MNDFNKSKTDYEMKIDLKDFGELMYSKVMNSILDPVRCGTIH